MHSSKPSVILVPGICHEASYFDGTKKQLENLGFEVCCRDNPSLNDPSKSWSDDRDALLEIMRPGMDAGKEFFLLTHSYGSAPAIAASESQSIEERSALGKKGGVRGIVVVSSGCVTKKGDSVVGKFGGEWPSYCLPDPAKNDGLAYPTAAARQGFYSDLDDETAAKLVAKLKPQSVASVTDPITWTAADLTIPAFYLQCEIDEAFPVQYQRRICDEIMGVTIASIQSGHSPYLSKPEEFIRQMVEWIEMAS